MIWLWIQLQENPITFPIPRHFLRRPAARRASDPPRVLPTIGLYDLTTAHFTYSRLQLDLLFYLISILDEATATQPLELRIQDLTIATARTHQTHHYGVALVIGQRITARQ